MRSGLKLQQLELAVSLGCSEEERAQKQKVIIDIDLHFQQLPLGCISDNLEDTVCYFTLVEKITAGVVEKSFHLIEYLGHVIFQIIKTHLPEDILVELRVSKKPPIENVGSATFYISEKI